MKYVILIYSNPASREIWDNMPAEERSVGLTAYEQLNAELEASGELIVTEALADPPRAKRVILDHIILAVFVIEIAARVPEAQLGLVELRPTLELSDFVS